MDNLDLDTYRQLISEYFVFYPDNGVKADELILEAIEYQYWHTGETGQGDFHGPVIGDTVMNMLGDQAIVCPVLSMADAYADAGLPVYHYLYSHRAENVCFCHVLFLKSIFFVKSRQIWNGMACAMVTNCQLFWVMVSMKILHSVKLNTPKSTGH